jgi:hypothetical protein
MKPICRAVGMTVLFAVSGAYAQNNLGDSDDQSAILPEGKSTAISVNVGDESFKASVSPMEDQRAFWTLQAKGKAANGVSSVFNGGDFASEFGITIGRAFRNLFSSTPGEKPGDQSPGYLGCSVPCLADDWVQLHVGYTRGTYSMFQEDISVDEAVKDIGKDLPEAGLTYNALHSSGKALFAIAGGIRKRTNYDSLGKINGIQREVVAGSGDSTITVEEDVDARSGELSVFNQWYVNIDLFMLPFGEKASSSAANRPHEDPSSRFEERLSVVAIDLFVRVVDNNATGDSELNPGVGLFLVEKDNPFAIKTGITLKYLDAKDEFQLGVAFGYKI